MHSNHYEHTQKKKHINLKSCEDGQALASLLYSHPSCLCFGYNSLLYSIYVDLHIKYHLVFTWFSKKKFTIIHIKHNGV